MLANGEHKGEYQSEDETEDEFFARRETEADRAAWFSQDA